MNRRYQDPRFPGLEIVNYGSVLFEVKQDGVSQGGFKSRETPGNAEVSEHFAQLRAQEYFQKLAAKQGTYSLLADGVAACKEEKDAKKKRELNRRMVRQFARDKSLAEKAVNFFLYDC